jgi:hypothetical protein
VFHQCILSMSTYCREGVCGKIGVFPDDGHSKAFCLSIFLLAPTMYGIEKEEQTMLFSSVFEKEGYSCPHQSNLSGWVSALVGDFLLHLKLVARSHVWRQGSPAPVQRVPSRLHPDPGQFPAELSASTAWHEI